MSKTFVYNTGNAKPAANEEHLQLGVFFDGTSNNRRNTEIRKKIQKVDEYADQNKLDNRASTEEIKIYQSKGMERTYKNLWTKKKESENSFANDFTNVSRLLFVTKKENSLYIEGIGTINEEDDTIEGLALGSGITGVRFRVRKGCEDLAKKIGNKKDEFTGSKKLTQIKIDVFGFSRGAAAARNFVYEVNSAKKRPEDVRTTKSKKIVGYTTGNFGSGTQSPIYESILIDSDREEVNEEYLIDGKYPKFGYLGYCLLSEGILSPEELEILEINFRFIGVYDTVASYDETYDNKVKMAGKLAGNYIKNKLDIGFDSAINSLQLNNLGSYNKAVHFTAMDEHRLNFALTKFPGAVEKKFPGVHSDVGGSYTNISEKVKVAQSSIFYPLNDLKDGLVQQHWFHEEQLEIYIKFQVILKIFEKKLIGIRELRKEYSYIPLHFMEEFFIDTLGVDSNSIIIDSVETKYPLEDIILNQSKNHLRKYVFGTGSQWNFRTDEEINKENAEKTLRKKLQTAELLSKNDKLNYKFSKPSYDNVDPANYQVKFPENFEIPKNKIRIEYDENGDQILTQTLEEVIVTHYPEQALLRKLRHGYLHWSSNLDALGMNPTKSWIRREY